MGISTTHQEPRVKRVQASTRRDFLVRGLGLAAGAAALPALSACGGESLGQTTNGLNLLLDHTSLEVQRFQKVVDQFQKQTGISVTVGNIATGASFYTKINTEGVARDLPDVWYARTFDTQYNVGKKWAEPLDSYIAKTPGFDVSDFWPALRAQVTTSGNVYSVPWNISDYVVFVNESMLEGAGVPLPSPDWDWPEFEQVASAIPVKRSGGRQNRYGASVGGLIGDWGLRGACTGNGSDLLSSDFATSTASAPSNVEFFTYLAGLANKGLTPTTAAFPATVDPFVGGLVGIAVEGSWNLAEYISEIGTNFKWSVLPLPKGTTGKRGVAVAGGGFAVSAFSAHKAEAFKLVHALTSPSAENSVVSAYLDSLPARQSCMPLFLKTAGTGQHSPAGIDNIQAETADALIVNYPPYETPYQTIITNRLATLLNGNVKKDAVVKMLKLIDTDTTALIKNSVQ